MGQVHPELAAAWGFEPRGCCAALCSHPCDVPSMCPATSSLAVAGDRYAASARRSPLPGEAWLFDCLPEDLAGGLRSGGQWEALRCRPWLAPAAVDGLVRSLEDCRPRELARRHLAAEEQADGTYVPPEAAPWEALENAQQSLHTGGLFRLDDLSPKRLAQLRYIGVQALLRGKAAAVFLAGGAGWRLGGRPPACCDPRRLSLPSGKSLLRLLCERLLRLAALCAATAGGDGGSPAEVATAEAAAGRAPSCSIPLLVMTSPLTHRSVMKHFADHGYFGLKKHDVVFFQQPADPALDAAGRLLPQSLGGAFARAPGGPGQVLHALEGSGALQKLLDRGVEHLHVLGTENLLARVCDPVFLGFCRRLNLDCACKVTDRTEALEDIELACVRCSPASAEADCEEAVCGVQPFEAPLKVLYKLDPATGSLAYHGSINSTLLSLTYIQQVKDRPVRETLVPRPVPYLDFFTVPGPEEERERAKQATLLAPADEGALLPTGIKPDRDLAQRKRAQPSGEGLAVRATAGRAHSSAPDTREDPRPPKAAPRALPPGAWPPAQQSSDPGGCSEQLRLLLAAAEVSERFELEDDDEALRCDVSLDPVSRLELPVPRGAAPGPEHVETSLLGGRPGAVAQGCTEEFASRRSSWRFPGSHLACSLVVPRKPNAFVLESTLLDWFAFSECAAMLHVPRASEFAPVSRAVGGHSATAARSALHALHCQWLLAAGARLGDFCRAEPEGAEGAVEVSPLLSYEGEGLEAFHAELFIAQPCHLPSPGEEPSLVEERLDAETHLPPSLPFAAARRGEALEAPKAKGQPSLGKDAFDTRPYYLQEYPSRKDVNPSRPPRFTHAGSQPTLGGGGGLTAGTDSAATVEEEPLKREVSASIVPRLIRGPAQQQRRPSPGLSDRGQRAEPLEAPAGDCAPAELAGGGRAASRELPLIMSF